MALKLQELQSREAITNSDGTPSRYFLQYLRSRGGALTDIEAELFSLVDRVGDVETNKVDKTTQVIAGAGLTGGGTLSGNVTLNVNSSGVLDGISSTRGSVLYRGAGGWSALPPGLVGDVLTSGGTGADPTWAVGGGGGGSIQTMLDSISSTQGTILYRSATAWTPLAPGTSGQLLGTNGSGANPSWTTPVTYNIQTMLDGISSTRGTILYRGASGWSTLSPGTSGDFLKTNGAGADPSWAAQASPNIQTLLDGISTTRGETLYYNGTDWVALAPGTSGYLLKTNGSGADPSWTAPANIQTLLDGISSTQGAVLYRGVSSWSALAPGTAGQFLKTNGAGFNPAWGTPSGSGSGGIYIRPSVVQYASSCANSGSVTFAAPVTPGNILVCVASHYNNVSTFTNGWSILLNRNGSSTDGNLIATKIADSGDSTVISVFGSVAGSNITIFEIQDSLGVVVLPWKDIQEQAGSSTTTLNVGIPSDKCLLVGAFSTVQANTAPTSVTGATAGTTVTGTSTSASPRQMTPFTNDTVTKGSQTITATYAATPRSYGYAVIALPSI